MTALRLGVIGLGRIAGVHLPALRSFPEVEIAAVVDFRDDRRAAMGDKFAVARRYRTVEEMLRDGELDAAWVLTNVEHTVEVAIACMEAGLHVFVEKPPGLYADDTRRMARVARDRRRINMVGFNRRFNPLVLPALQAATARGPLAHLLSQWHKDNLPRTLNLLGETVAATLLRSDLIHPLDLLRFCGGEVRRLHGRRRKRFTEFDDAFDALIEFESGAVGHLVSSSKSPRKIERLQLVGEEVVVELDGDNSSFTRGVVFDRGGQRELRLDNVKRTDRLGFWDEDRYFVDCLLRGAAVTSPAADLEDAVKSVALADEFVMLS